MEIITPKNATKVLFLLSINSFLRSSSRYLSNDNFNKILSRSNSFSSQIIVPPLYVFSVFIN